jgi:hypothetical protein
MRSAPIALDARAMASGGSFAANLFRFYSKQPLLPLPTSEQTAVALLYKYWAMATRPEAPAASLSSRCSPRTRWAACKTPRSLVSLCSLHPLSKRIQTYAFIITHISRLPEESTVRNKRQHGSSELCQHQVFLVPSAIRPRAPSTKASP